MIKRWSYENIFYIPDRVIFGYPYSSANMEWRLRRVVPAGAVTTHAKPHAQQQLARDVEVERAVDLKAPGLVSCVRQHASDLPSSRITSLCWKA